MFWGYRALIDKCRAVCPVGVFLENAVPMLFYFWEGELVTT
jgi:hypothetical protein